MSELIKRQILNGIRGHLTKKEITLLVGARQVGKTTLMNILLEELRRKGEKTVFLSMDFEDDKRYFVSQSTLLRKLELEFGRGKGYVFIDEIQRKGDAGVFLKGIYDLGLPHKFIVSGSGSLELKEKIHESLAGRKMVFEVDPVSFFEFADFKTGYRYEGRLSDFFEVESDKTMSLLEGYLNFGGYPRVVGEETLSDKIRMIDEIYRSYLERDISYWLEVEKIDAFNSLVKLLAAQAGNLINYSEISSTLGISQQTVKNYLWYLEKTFIVRRVTPYSRNARKEITKSPVVYFGDSGLRSYARGSFGRIYEPAELGLSFENLIFNILREIFSLSNVSIHFWRTKDGAEVDFLIDSGKEAIPLEVKYGIFREPKIERALRSFIDKYEPKRAFVINRNLEEIVKVGGTEVMFMPFWKLRQELFL